MYSIFHEQEYVRNAIKITSQEQNMDEIMDIRIEPELQNNVRMSWFLI